VNELADLPAAELLRLYRARRASPVEAVKAALERIGRHDRLLGAFCLEDAHAALHEARESEARWQRGAPRGPLDGVPTSIKDLIVTRGWPTLRGSRTVDPHQRWDDDAPAVARLREQGAVLIGKTATPEFGWKAVTDSALTGVTRNPWDPSKTPGGSSGGSAAAIAAGMGALTVGTDGGGSIRVPASFTGIFGLKPTFGRVPAWPLSPFGTVAHLGPMTRTVTDAALAMNALALPDARDWHALPPETADWRIGLDDGVRGLRIAFSADLGYVRVEPEVAEAVERAARELAEAGAHVEPCDPGFVDPTAVFKTHWYSGAALLARSLGPAQREMLDPGLREIVAAGEAFSARDLVQAAYDRGNLGVLMQAFFERFDLLVTPATPITAFAAGEETPDRTRYPRWIDWAAFSHPFNLTQQPAASIPCGFTRDGLPIGLQIVGPKYADRLVLRAARAFEMRHPIRLPDLSTLR
jgi:aspartyl-tRNA(Asn)/glutamyl-tRNA(Gln) amidotransferase subunit A